MKSTALIDGVKVVTCGELCKRLGVTISANGVLSLGIKPFAETKTTTYWREQDIPQIGWALAMNICARVGAAP